MDPETLVNGVAGLAALVNSLILWPLYRGLKNLGEKHDERLRDLEVRVAAKPRKRRTRGSSAR